MKKASILILSIFLLASCSKNEDSKPETEQEANSCQVKIIDFIEGGQQLHKLYFTYNDQGKVRRVDYDTQNSTNYETFDYQSDKIIKYKNDGAASETLTFILDANSRIISIKNYTFKYNTDGYLIESKSSGTDLTITKTYTYTNGNLTKKDYLYNYSTGRTDNYSSVYEYNSDAYQSIGGHASAIEGFEYDNSRVLNEFFGKTSKNLITNSSFNSPGGSSSGTTYLYQKDDKGKMISIKTKFNQVTSEYKLTYDCN